MKNGCLGSRFRCGQGTGHQPRTASVAHHQHRHMHHPQHALGHAAQHQLFQAAPAMRTHDDQVGASGSLITVKAIHELQRIQGRYALVTMSIGGGQRIAAIFERISPPTA